MSKANQKLLNIDLDIVKDSNGHQLVRKGDQTFLGLKTFNAPPHSQMSKPEADNTAVTKAMLKNATRCVNEIFEETLTVEAADIANGYILLSKEIPTGKESSLEIIEYEGAGPLVYGVDFGAETKKLVLAGYELERDIAVGDELEVRYMICADVIVTLEDIKKIIYAPELGENGLFVAFGSDAIYYSEDGVDWYEAVEVDNSDNNWRKFYSADYSPTLRRFVASYHKGYLVSNDGKEWTKYDGGPGIVLWAGSLGAFYCFYGVNGHAYESPDVYRAPDGRSWSKIGTHDGLDSFYSYFLWSVVWDETRRRFFKTLEVRTPYEGSYSIFYNLYSSENGVGWQQIEYLFPGEPEWSHILSPEMIAISPTRMCIYDYYDFNGENVTVYFGESFYAISKNDGATWAGYDNPIFLKTWLSGLNIFIGTANEVVNEVLHEYSMAISPDGENVYVTDDLTMSDVFCYAQDRDTMLFARDGFIEVVTEFSARIKSAWFKRIPLLKLEADDSGSGSGSSDSGGGDNNDNPIDIDKIIRGIHLPGLFPGRT